MSNKKNIIEANGFDNTTIQLFNIFYCINIY